MFFFSDCEDLEMFFYIFKIHKCFLIIANYDVETFRFLSRYLRAFHSWRVPFCLAGVYFPLIHIKYYVFEIELSAPQSEQMALLIKANLPLINFSVRTSGSFSRRRDTYNVS